MDNNKLKILKNINYSKINCCGLCEHGIFNDNQIFGVCNKYKYDHLKHTGKEIRYMSIFKYGICNSPGKMILDKNIENFISYLK